MSTPTYYKSAIKITAICGIMLFFPLLILYILASGGHFPAWLLDAIGLLLPLCTQVSANGYIAKFFDFVKNYHLKKDKKLINAENIGLTVGLVTSVIFSIISIVLFHMLPGASVLLLISSPSNFGGLGNRTGRFIDYFKNNIKNKNILRNKSINYVISVGCGIIIGLVLTTLIMFTSAATFGVLPAILLTIGTISACASACGYVGRCADFLLGERTIFDSNAPTSSFKERCHSENMGTMIGVGIGITAAIIATTLVILGIATLPFFGAGLPKLALGLMIFISLISAGGGIGNRIGHAIDVINPCASRLEAKPEPAAAIKTIKPKNPLSQLGKITENSLINKPAISTSSTKMVKQDRTLIFLGKNLNNIYHENNKQNYHTHQLEPPEPPRSNNSRCVLL